VFRWEGIMQPLPPELYHEDVTQISILTPRVFAKAKKGLERAERNRHCGRYAVGLFLLGLAAAFVKHNLESPIGLVELELMIFMSCMMYCLAICIVAGEPTVKIEVQ
jgi:hypothetical protein